MAQYYGVTRSETSLSHYGVKGMKWGVRRAIYSGNQKALDRHYQKAAKKLAKLTDIGLNSKKYAAKAAAYGAAAAGTGTLAVGGVKTAANSAATIGKHAVKLYALGRIGIGKGLSAVGLKSLGNQIAENGRVSRKAFRQDQHPIINRIDDFNDSAIKWGNKKQTLPIRRKYSYTDPKTNKTTTVLGDNIKISNDALFRTGAGLATAGLAAKAAQNAYRATHGAKYRAKALNFKNEMDKAFAGTKYEGHYERPKRRKKRG